MVKEWNSPLIFVLPHLFDYVVVAWDNHYCRLKSHSDSRAVMGILVKIFYPVLCFVFVMYGRQLHVLDYDVMKASSFFCVSFLCTDCFVFLHDDFFMSTITHLQYNVKRRLCCFFEKSSRRRDDVLGHSDSVFAEQVELITQSNLLHPEVGWDSVVLFSIFLWRHYLSTLAKFIIR